MTPTEKARRIDALVQGPEGRRDLACMIVNREADLEDACESVKRLMTQRDERLARAEADNAKLRKELSKWERLTAGIDLPEYPVTQFKPKDLERDNGRLRELVSDMWHELNYTSARAENGTNHCLDHMAAFDARIRELGVEVEQ